MQIPSFVPPFLLKNGLSMTVYVALQASKTWEETIQIAEPNYQETLFLGAKNVPIHGKFAIPPNAKGTIIGTYGITGTLENQWYLKILGRKAFSQGYGVVLFDWRAHGKTAELSPVLTSDGLYEGEDFVRIAAQAKKMGCPAPFWLMGYSLGGQLALWGLKAAQDLTVNSSEIDLDFSEIGGCAVICPSLDSTRSLRYLMQHPLGRYLEQAIAKELKRLATRLHQLHPQDYDLDAIARATTIWGFDQELVIPRLGFPSVEAYYQASSALAILPQLQKPTFILYAMDDPMFDPALVQDLQEIGQQNPHLEVVLTPYGGHVGYLSSRQGQKLAQDSDPWWAWNRILNWIG